MSTWEEAGVCLCLLHISLVSAKYHNFAQPYVRARPSPIQTHMSFASACCLGVSCYLCALLRWAAVWPRAVFMRTIVIGMHLGHETVLARAQACRSAT